MSTKLTTAIETKTELKLAPTIRRRLLTELAVYARLDEQLKALELAKSKQKGKIDTLREEVGVDSLTIDGYKVTVVAPTRSKLEPKKLIALGVSQAMIEEATVVVPGKAYLKISLPGERDGSNAE